MTGGCPIGHTGRKTVKRMDKFQISLAAARVNAGMTQENVAKKMGVTKQTVINWEKGKVGMKAAQFKMYCDVVGAPEDIIILPDK